MLRSMLSALCVLATASPLLAKVAASDIAGRWQGDTYAREGGGKLTLDIVACGAGWCGIMVGADEACGATALKLDAGTGGSDRLMFKGTLELARGTEPYVIHTYLISDSDGRGVRLHMVGDTGGTFRAFRRSFPFEAEMARTRDAVCRTPQTLSMAQ